MLLLLPPALSTPLPSRHLVQVMVPITVVTAPILAIENGLDALSVALNVMAILYAPCVPSSPLWPPLTTLL